MSDNDDTLLELQKILISLTDGIWDTQIDMQDIDRWTQNFTGLTGDIDQERIRAIHLLTQFNHFGLAEVRELLHALYRDLYRYPIIQEVRRTLQQTRDASAVETEFQKELSATRFLGMGNPADSGSHLLYYFRQVNDLRSSQFISQHEILDSAFSNPKSEFADGMRRIVFVDDILGSGRQASTFSKTLLADLDKVRRRTGQKVRFCYYVLFARPRGLELARSTLFDEVDAVHELDDNQQAFSASSRAYSAAPNGLDLADGQILASTYGKKLFPSQPLGFGDGQLLIGMHHNIPNNTLPIFWSDKASAEWQPIFRRYGKRTR